MKNRADSRNRLLDSAEKLFGSKGIQATSIRDITAAARTNLAAVNYYFGTKEGLLAAVLERRAAPINAERIRKLEALQTGSGTPSVEQVLEAFLAPTIDMLENHPSFMRFAGRMVSEPDPRLRRILIAQFSPLARRFHAALESAAPDADHLDLWWCLGFLVGAMIHTWTNRSDIELFSGHSSGDASPRAVVDRLIRFCAAGIRAQARAGGGAQ